MVFVWGMLGDVVIVVWSNETKSKSHGSLEYALKNHVEM